MDTIKIANKGGTKFVAHRGLSGLEQENTCAAFVAAGNRSYCGIETDLRKTVDGKFVLFHDEDTSRMCIDKLIPEESTYQTLTRLQYKDIDGTFGRRDLMPATLEEYVSICKRYGKTGYLELKGSYSLEQLEMILDTLRGCEYEQGIVFISFQLANLLNVRTLVPQAPAQWLTADVSPETIRTIIENRLDIDAQFKCLTPENVRIMHENGVTVNCWTVNKPEDAQRLIRMGVDQITTNILE